jgi:DNA (cytosine-5)-methyltransferase 1
VWTTLNDIMSSKRPKVKVCYKNSRPAKELLSDLREIFSQTQIAEMLQVDARTVRRWETGEVACPPYLAAAIDAMLRPIERSSDFTFIDLFAGIGGFRMAFESVGGQCVFTSEWNKYARQTYAANFRESKNHIFSGDITKVNARDIPDHNVLLAGFPCQPFSIAGVSKKNSLGRSHGFKDATQGTLFFDVARIIAEKRPQAFVLENVKNLTRHDKGRTFEVIKSVLCNDLGYNISYRVIDSRSWVPQGRQRIVIVGLDKSTYDESKTFNFDLMKVPKKNPCMDQVLHSENGSEPAEEPYTTGSLATVNNKYILSKHLWTYLKEYAAKHKEAGNGFGYGIVTSDDVARTLSARYYKDGSEILISRGPRRIPRRLTPRECARVMGFPDDFIIPVSDTQAYKQFGNSLVVPMMKEVAVALHSQVELDKRISKKK